MMSHIVRRFASPVALLVFATAAHAQIGAVSNASAGPSAWLWTTTAEQGWDSNVRYVADGDPDRILRLRSALSVRRQGARGAVSLLGGGNLIRYGKTTGLNTFAYEAELAGTRRFTLRTTGTVGAFSRTQLATDVYGAANLPLLVLANQKAVGGTASLERRFTPTTTGRIEGGYATVTFDTPLLVPGSALTGKALLTHKYRSRGSVLLTAEAQDGKAMGIPLSMQSLSAGWDASVGHVQVRVIPGVTHIAAGGPSRMLATGLAQVADSLGPGAWTVGVSRLASQAFGLGQLLTTNAATVAYDFQARRGNFFTLAAAIADSHESTGAGTQFQSSSLTAAMRRVLLSGVTFGWGVSWRQRKDISQAEGFAAQAQFGYSLGSR